MKNVGITGHIRPDGDCVGSCMALYNYIISNYEDICVDVYLEDVGEEFNFITNIDCYKIRICFLFNSVDRYDST
ncbi:MAG: DHH family phosphoesterase [Lachnospiraceae bacterium]|nr:DHH family phosphoesterase [Lachnospiraceae bacterium]